MGTASRYFKGGGNKTKTAESKKIKGGELDCGQGIHKTGKIFTGKKQHAKNGSRLGLPLPLYALLIPQP